MSFKLLFLQWCMLWARFVRRIAANLYRPSQPGRYPGILLQAGHTQEGKPEGQRLAANLALKGFVTLAFDPVGQGEREQTYDRRVDRPLAGWSVPEHIQAGAQNMLDSRRPSLEQRRSSGGKA